MSRRTRTKAAARSAGRIVARKVLLAGPVRDRMPIAVARRLPNGKVRAELLLAVDQRHKADPQEFDSAPTIYDFTMSGNTVDHIQRRIFVFGVWEPNLSQWMAGYLRPGDVMVDVGANIGYFALLAAKRVGPTGRVIAFEPVPSICDQLRRNIALNGVSNIDVRPIALGEADGDIEVYRGPDKNIGRSSTTAWVNGTSEGHVEKRRGVEAIDRALWPKVRVVKIDVEGDEFAVLQGLEEFLREAPDGTAVVAEITREWLETRGQSGSDAIAFMRGLGYVTFHINNSYSPEDYAFGQPSKPTRLKRLTKEKSDVLFIKRAQPVEESASQGTATSSEPSATR